MANFVYNKAKRKLLTADIDLNADDIRILAVKAAGSTTTDTEDDAEFIGSFTTLGEIVATNYVRKAVTGEAVADDAANNRAEFTFSAVTWTALGGAVNDTIGAFIVYKHVTNDADSIPILYIDTATGVGLPYTTNGADLTFTPNAEGVLHYRGRGDTPQVLGAIACPDGHACPAAGAYAALAARRALAAGPRARGRTGAGMTNKAVEIRCPECGRWLMDAIGFARVICRDCGCEITYRSREQRQVIDKSNETPLRFPRQRTNEPLAAHT
jgi:hypothetical protein